MTMALGIRTMLSLSPGRQCRAWMISRFATLPEESTRPMPYSIEVSRGRR